MRDRLIELIKASSPNTIEGLAEDLLAAGVIVPPCKVGDVVYVIDTFNEVVLAMQFNSCMLDAFGRTVFLTKEEAEKALAERRERDEKQKMPPAQDLLGLSCWKLRKLRSWIVY